jgi:hypothetical protein
MLIDWPKLIAALVLLWTPIALFHGKRVSYRALMRDWDGYWGRTLSLGLHTVDFARAALGAWLLLNALAAAPNAHGILRHTPLLVTAAVLLPAAAVQTLVCKEAETAHAPFAFMAGLVVGYMPPLMLGQVTPFLVAGFALLLTAVIAYGGSAPASFFPTLAVTLAASGVLFAQKKLLLPLAVLCSTVTLPWLLTLLFPRHFVVSYLKRPIAAHEVPPPPKG